MSDAPQKTDQPAPAIFTRGPLSPAHDHNDPQFTIITCMKNEGPFILEWLAYHRSIGIQNFVVFTNDCTDGTDLILDRLDELGLVTHLPNPAGVAQSTFYQPLALKYAWSIPFVRRSDYILATDVDEFINIHVGDGSMAALLEATGPFHALSMSEVNFCSAGHYYYEDVWLTAAFREHETKQPGHWQARRGVKSIIHNVDNFAGWQAHRPIAYKGTEKDLIWLNGSGKPVDPEFAVKIENGMDRRGCYDLVTLDHHPLRSAQSFLIKHDRGDVVNVKNNVSHHYYRMRSIGKCFDGAIDNKLANARREWNRMMADSRTAELHRTAVSRHKSRIAQLEANPSPAIAELRSYIVDNYFKGGIGEPPK